MLQGTALNRLSFIVKPLNPKLMIEAGIESARRSFILNVKYQYKHQQSCPDPSPLGPVL